MELPEKMKINQKKGQKFPPTDIFDGRRTPGEVKNNKSNIKAHKKNNISVFNIFANQLSRSIKIKTSTKIAKNSISVSKK